MTEPSAQVLVILWYQEDFVGYMVEEFGNLSGRDLAAFAQWGVQVYYGWCVGLGAKAMGLAYDVEAFLCRTHPV